jgi:hypothetical protein
MENFELVVNCVMVVNMCILYGVVVIMLNLYIVPITYVKSVMLLKFDELNCYILSFHTCDVQRAAKTSYWADDTHPNTRRK